MIVAYAPGGDCSVPMIRLANQLLADCGFSIGSKIDVEYKESVITIKLNHEFKYNIPQPSPFALLSAQELLQAL